MCRGEVKMRRLTSLFLIVLMILCGNAYAEQADVKGLTLDELVELRNLIDAEIRTRFAGSSAVLYPAEYLVGEHIPAGQYLITGIEVMEGAYVKFWVYPKGDSYYNATVAEYLSGSTYFIDLKENDVLKLSLIHI